MRVRFAGAPVSFGVDEVQADAWRPTPDVVVGAVADLALEGIELGPPEFLGSPQEARLLLERHGLELAGAYFPLPFARDDDFSEALQAMPRLLDELKERCTSSSRPTVILGDAFDQPARLRIACAADRHPEAWLPPDRRTRLVDNIHRAAEASQRAGFDAVIHPHVGTYIETEYEILDVAERIDPALVGLCLDTGHIRLGGGDPTRVARAFRHLIRHVHVKDCDPATVGRVVTTEPGLRRTMEMDVFCELGRGDVDLAGVVAELHAMDYEGWIVLEQDRKVDAATGMDNLTESVRRNLAWITDRVAAYDGED